MPFYEPPSGIMSATYEYATLVEELTTYGTKVGLSENQAREVIRVTWEHYQHRGFSFALAAPEIRDNMILWSLGERWRP